LVARRWIPEAPRLKQFAHSASRDVAILFCQDSDLTPALELTRGLSRTRIETAGWSTRLRHGIPGVWQTFLIGADFASAHGTFAYAKP
jgi:hypothetical protein